MKGDRLYQSIIDKTLLNCYLSKSDETGLCYSEENRNYPISPLSYQKMSRLFTRNTCVSKLTFKNKLKDYSISKNS